MSYRFIDSLRAGAYAPARKLSIKPFRIHTMEACRDIRSNLQNQSFTTALDGGEWAASSSDCFTLVIYIPFPMHRRLEGGGGWLYSRSVLFIIIIINCHRVTTRWQWLFYMYTNMR
jgi:hypothetical protein